MRIIIFIPVLILSSCKCLQYCKNPPETTTIIEYRDTIIPGASVMAPLPSKGFSPSLPQGNLPRPIMYLEGKPYKVLQEVEDTASKARLRILEDELGNQIAHCEALDQELKKVRELKQEKIPFPVEVKPWWFWPLIGVLILAVLGLIFMRR